MNKILIALLFLVSQYGLAKSLWGLNSDTESRLLSALELSHAHKVSKSNKMGGFVTVGDDSNCDFRVGANKIQNAIDSGATEIRIASNSIYEENVVINNPNVSLILRGGFSDCSQADLGNQSDLVDDWAIVGRFPGSFGAVFLITGLPQGNTIVFENIKIISSDLLTASGSSIKVDGSDSDLILDKVWITQGAEISGGGLQISNSNSTTVLKNTEIFNNAAANGGGLYCNNTSGVFKNTTIVLDETSSIHDNSVRFDGGGAYIGNDCLLTSFSGSVILSSNSGIVNNTANRDGGGLYVIDDGKVLIYGGKLCDVNNECFGNEDAPASVSGNNADSDSSGFDSGGGIYASGSGTDITIIAGYLSKNTNNNGIGGGLALFDNAQLTINHPRKNNLALSCWNSYKCNMFEGNSAISGGAIYSSSFATIEHVFFEDNEAENGAVITSTISSTTEIQSSVIDNNGSGLFFNSNSIFEVMDNANLNIKYSTIADNIYNGVVFDVVGSFSNFNIQSSIVHDSSGLNIINSFTGTVSSSCVMGHEVASLTGTSNSINDPMFIDRLNRNYHLNSTNSPAIDYCDAIPLIGNNIPMPSKKDIDFQSHGFDNINLSNLLGPYDLGADEAYPQNFVTVGMGASCDFNTNSQSIQDAINTGVQEIRLAKTGSYTQPFTIDNINLKLIGGFETCDDALNNIQTFTSTSLLGTIGPVEPIIIIKGSSLRNTVILEKLILSGADNSAITAISTNTEIILNNVLIKQNNLAIGFSGGAIFTSNSNVDFTLHNSRILQNTATNGGGIYCSGEEASIKLTGLSGIVNNSADGKGGGIHITNGCQLTVYSGTLDPVSLTFTGIQGNNAKQEGGGIYADLGAKVVLYGHEFCSASGVCVGNNTNPVNVNNNRSDSDSSGGERGGGIYLTGLGTSVEIYAGLIQGNLSPNGAGVYVNDQASLTVARLFKDCWDPVRCNLFQNNRAFTTGGAIQNDQGIVNISSTYFEGNKGIAGSALYAFGALSRNRIEGSVFNHNKHVSSTNNAYVIRAAVSAKVEIVHSTFADNSVENTAVFGIASNSELKLFSSIINDPTGVVLDTNPGTTIINCVMAHETSSFSGSNIFLNDPDFIDRVNLDYHLSVNSPAIDVCDNSFANVQFRDIDFESRGVDNPNAPNNIGTYDIGADETSGSDVLFANGFE